MYKFTGHIVEFEDNPYIQLPDTTNPIKIYIENIKEQKFGLNNNQFEFNIYIHTRNCTKGEIYIDNSLQGQKLYTCFKCPEGKYAYHNKECVVCESNAICPGGAYVLVEEGFWSKSNTSAHVHDCGDFRKFCKGSLTYHEEVCTGGHYGPLC